MFSLAQMALIGAVTLATEPPALPGEKSQAIVAPVEDTGVLSYAAGIEAAKAKRKPLVTFVNRQARSIDDAVVARESRVEGLAEGVYVSVFGNGVHLGMPVAAGASDAEIRAAAADLKARLEPTPAPPASQPAVIAPPSLGWQMLGGMNPYAQCQTGGG